MFNLQSFLLHFAKNVNLLEALVSPSLDVEGLCTSQGVELEDCLFTCEVCLFFASTILAFSICFLRDTVFFVGLPILLINYINIKYHYKTIYKIYNI